MARPNPGKVTQLLEDWNGGDPAAASKIWPLVYNELQRIANRCFRRERQGHTLQPTAVVHEAYTRLAENHRIPSRNRVQFFGLAARVMRQVLVDYSRERGALKRGGANRRVTFAELAELAQEKPPDVVALDDALNSLQRLDPQKVAIVELRFFAGLTIAETAAVLGIGTATVTRQWQRAQAWLYRELAAAEGD